MSGIGVGGESVEERLSGLLLMSLCVHIDRVIIVYWILCVDVDMKKVLLSSSCVQVKLKTM